MKIESLEGATPIDPDTMKGLIPNITLKAELDEFEQSNIARTVLWSATSRKLKSQLLTATGLCLLHQKMFDQVWTWAGKFRTRPTSPGVEPAIIQNQLGALIGDTKYWIENKTYSGDEIAIRFHHRLVFIHPFPNGNGRFSRLAADLLLDQMEAQRFSWGRDDIAAAGDIRNRYLAALRLADKKSDYTKLLEFARS